MGQESSGEGTKAGGTFDRRRGRITLGVCGTAHILHDGFSDALYVLMPIWAQSFGLSLAQVGVLKMVYSGALASFQTPAGLLSERFGERALLAVGTVLTGLGYVLLGFAGGFATLILFLLLAGLASGVQHPLSSTLVARAYEAGPRRAALGIYNFTGDVGKVAAPAVIALGVGAIGWQSSVMAYGALGVVAGAVILAVLRKIAAGAPVVRAPPQQGAPAPVQGWGVLNPRGFQTISAINVIDTAIIYGLLTFLPFLLMDKGARVETVGFSVALIFSGGAAGKFLCGIFAERFGIIRTAAVTELVTGAGILALLFLPLTACLIALPVLGVALMGTSSVLYATVAEMVAAERHSRAFGLFYTVGIAAGAAAPPLLGLISDAAGVAVALAILGGGAFLTLPLCWMLAASRQAVPREDA